MSQVAFEEGLIAFSVFMALWFLAAGARLRKSVVTREIFIDNYAEICDDNSVPMHLLEALNIVFKVACGYCVCARLLTMFFFREARSDTKLRFELHSMEQQRLLKLAVTIKSFMIYITYGASLIGTITRLFFLKTARGKRVDAGSSAVELAAATELLANAKLGWR